MKKFKCFESRTGRFISLHVIIVTLLLGLVMRADAQTCPEYGPEPNCEDVPDDPCCTEDDGPGGDDSDCSSCGENLLNQGTQPTGAGDPGMPVWRVIEPDLRVEIVDIPLAYQPATGKPIEFKLSHEQEWSWDDNIHNGRVFSFGEDWFSDWQGYISLNYDGFGDDVYKRGGREIRLDSQGEIEYHAGTGIKIEQQGNGDYHVMYRSGAYEVLEELVANDLYVMTKIVDADGREIILDYDDDEWDNNQKAKLIKVTDADDRDITLDYEDGTYDFQVTSVTDDFGREVTIEYDGSGRLESITDTAGLTTSFSYTDSILNINDLLVSMTTPYGTTTFNYESDESPPFHFTTGNHIGRAITVELPNGGRHLYMYREEASELSDTDDTPLLPYSYTNEVPSTSIPGEFTYTNSFDNVDMDMWNSFRWTPLQYDSLSTTNLSNFTVADYTLASMRHWLRRDSALGWWVTRTVSMERGPSPDGGNTEGQKTWFDYYGKPGSNQVGTNSQPAAIAKKLPNGDSWFTVYEYNSKGKPTEKNETYTKSDGSVGVRTWQYDYYNNDIDLLSVTDPDNDSEGYNMDTSTHQVLAITNALDEVTTFEYDAYERLTNVVNEATGLTTRYTYFDVDSGSPDDSGLLKEIIQVGFSTNSYTYEDALVKTRTDARGLTVTNTWDNLLRLTSVQYPDGTTISNVYTSLDRTATKDRLGNWTYFSYNSVRQLTSVTNPLSKVTSYGYCDCGSLTSMTNAVDDVTTYLYDTAGRMTNAFLLDGSWSVTNTYNLLGQLTSVEDSQGVLEYDYNNQGLLTTVSNAAGLVSRTLYDIEDQPIEVEDANGIEIDQTFDELGRLLSRTYPNNATEGFGYTAKGLVYYTNQLDKVTQHDYDALGRMTVTTNANDEVIAYSYSGAGDLLSLTDGESNTTTWNYDEYGRVTNKVDDLSVEILRYQYDANGQLTNRWSKEKGDTAYTYDDVGNLTGVDYPASQDLSFDYDAVNRLTNMVDATGTTKFTYTGFGALESEDGPWDDDVVSYGYNGARLLSSVSVARPHSGAWTQSYGYDSSKRLDDITNPLGTFDYDYNTTQKAIFNKVSFPSGSYVTNKFDSLARLEETWLKDSANTALNKHVYVYNDGNQRTKQTLIEGNYLDYVYDNIGQLIAATGKESGGSTRLHEKFGYGYDAANNLNTRTNNMLEETFSVNDVNELTAISRTDDLTVSGTTGATATNVTVNANTATLYGDNTFAWAGTDNVSAGNNTFTAIASDSFGRSSTNSITVNLPSSVTPTYDDNGNLTNDDNRDFVYDDENQLIEVHVDDEWRTTFTYDGRGRLRVRKEYDWTGSSWSLASETRYIYDGMLVLQERNADNLPTVTYTRGLDLSGTLQGAGGIGGLLARTDHQNGVIPTVYYHSDGNGNVTALANDAEAVVGRYHYDPFGGRIAASGPAALDNAYRFSSKEFHANSGLYYYGYRFYDPNLQRWLNRDPIEEDGGINLYGFVDNSPIDYVDFLGLAKDKACVQDCRNKLQECYSNKNILNYTFGGGALTAGLQAVNKTGRKPRGGVAGGGRSGGWTSWTRKCFKDAGKAIGRTSVRAAGVVGAAVGISALHKRCLLEFNRCLQSCEIPTCPLPPMNCSINSIPNITFTKK